MSPPSDLDPQCRCQPPQFNIHMPGVCTECGLSLPRLSDEECRRIEREQRSPPGRTKQDQDTIDAILELPDGHLILQWARIEYAKHRMGMR